MSGVGEVGEPGSAPPEPPGAAAARLRPRAGWLLAPLSWIYAGGAWVNRARWRRGGRQLPRPVISVGNITCGGTGKTPTVERIARELLERGRRPAILSRGYGARLAARGGGAEGGADHAGNDEHRMLAERLPGVPHLQGPDRFVLGLEAIAEGADVLVLDDGFQHFALARDLDIVLVDALAPFGGGMLPAGRRREPIGALRHADLLAITRCELAGSSRLEELEGRLGRRFPDRPVVRLETRPVAWRSLAGTEREEPGALRGRRVLAVCAIGHPEAFLRQVASLGAEVVGRVLFRDHHRYRARDVERVAEEARRRSAEHVATTLKDAVKLREPELRARMGDLPWRYLEIEQDVLRGRSVWDAAIDRALGAPRKPDRGS